MLKYAGRLESNGVGVRKNGDGTVAERKRNPHCISTSHYSLLLLTDFN
jgi:hypothetical protein